jgi:Domain of unknown function (DUF4184)
MPFTLAHPAAVLPLRGVWRLRMAPLIVLTAGTVLTLEHRAPGAGG